MTYAKKKLTGMGAGTPDLMDTQAKCMEETCNLWVPRYNQLGMLSQAIPKPGLAEKKEKQFMEHMEHTVTCVEEAFTYFLENRPDKTRPFVIFGHSQGSIMMTRAIKDHLAGTEHQKYFIAAYLAGGYLPKDLLPMEGDLHECTGPLDSNCIISWDTRIEGVWKPEDGQTGAMALWPHSLYRLLHHKYCEEETAKDPDSKPRVQINPLTWNETAGVDPEVGYLGAKKYNSDEPDMPPDGEWAAAVKSSSHTLWMPKTDPWQTEPGPAYSSGNMHPADVTTWFYNIKQNVAARCAAFEAPAAESEPNAE